MFVSQVLGSRKAQRGPVRAPIFSIRCDEFGFVFSISKGFVFQKEELQYDEPWLFAGALFGSYRWHDGTTNWPPGLRWETKGGSIYQSIYGPVGW